MARKPARSTAAAAASTLSAPGAKRRVARSVARLTLASTPGKRLSTFSSRVEQAAQVIPSIASSSVSSSSCRRPSESFFCMVAPLRDS